MIYWLGTLVLICATLKLTELLWLVLRHYMATGLDYKSFGKWAIVTGCTDGIGLALAKELALRGMNIVLVSRSKEKLNAAAAEIEKIFGVETKCILIDFSQRSSEYLPRFEAEVSDLDIGVLVNNVGLSQQHPNQFINLPIEEIDQIVQVNVASTLAITNVILPIFKRKDKGLIINMSSAAGVIPSPFLAIYAASKAFVLKLSSALRLEHAETGIQVKTLYPMVVNTKMSKIKRVTVFTPSPAQYARSALTILGSVSETTGCLPHDIQIWFINLHPKCLKERRLYGILKRAFKRGRPRQDKSKSQ